MFTAMLWSGGHVAIAHIGTTRAYVLRDGILTQLTRDHTLGQLLVDEGSISAHEVGSDKRHSLIVGDLGSGQPSHRSLEITIRDVELADRYLLTAFGHQDVVSLDVVHDPSATPQAAAHAIAGNTRDDITVIVADVVDQPSSSDHPAVKRGGPWMNPQ